MWIKYIKSVLRVEKKKAARIKENKKYMDQNKTEVKIVKNTNEKQSDAITEVEIETNEKSISNQTQEPTIVSENEIRGS